MGRYVSKKRPKRILTPYDVLSPEGRVEYRRPSDTVRRSFHEEGGNHMPEITYKEFMNLGHNERAMALYRLVYYFNDNISAVARFWDVSPQVVRNHLDRLRRKGLYPPAKPLFGEDNGLDTEIYVDEQTDVPESDSFEVREMENDFQADAPVVILIRKPGSYHIDITIE